MPSRPWGKADDVHRALERPAEGLTEASEQEAEALRDRVRTYLT